MSIENFGIEEYITECSYTDNEICISEYIIEKLIDTSDNVDINTIETLKKITNCDDQKCILTYMKNDNVITHDEYEKELINVKPQGPALTREWISDKNINDVLVRFHKLYPKFYYFPYQMIDFAKYNTKFYTANWKRLIKDYDTFGVIINTDRWQSQGNGLHWFAIFIDARRDTITVEYFNSSGHEPYLEIKKWYNKVEKELPLSKFIQVVHNPLQQNNDACGVYCLFYFYYRLKGISYKEFTSQNVYDKKMTKFRQFLFA